MDCTQTHTLYQRSNSEQLDVNVKLFTVVQKRNISIKEKVKKIRKLLGKKPQPDINAQDGNDNGNSALHMAIERNELEVVNFLLREGADTTIENGDGKTPLQLAQDCNYVEIIDVLKGCISQVECSPSETDRLAPHNSQPVATNPNEASVSHSSTQTTATGKQTASTVLPPFSGKLRVDKELKLSKDDFKQSIEKYYENKGLSAIDQLKATPNYPTPHLLAQFAKKAYADNQHAKPEAPAGWKLLTTATNCRNGYFGTAYWHAEHQQVVIAHRGTDTKSPVDFLKDLYSNINGVLRNKYVDQMNSASTFAHKVVAVLQEILQGKKVSFEVFFTGHSLGGWLAQITTFTTEYLEVKEGTFLKKQKTGQDKPPGSSTVQDSHDVTHSYHPHTVVFDSPGCEKKLLQLKKTFDVRHHGSSIDLQHLDITSYLSAPNRINTCNSHLGTVYRIFTDLPDMGWKEKHSPLYNLATHSMDKIVQIFDSETGQVIKDDKGEPKIRHVVDWPVSAGLTGGAEWENFFKWAEHLNNYHPEVMDTVHGKVPKGYHPLRYQTKAYDDCTKSLSTFTQDEREFLQLYRWLRQVPELFEPEILFSVLNDAEATKQAEQKLQDFNIDNEKIRCTEANILHDLIPYVKRMVRLFPKIKENIMEQLSSAQIKNTVYQYETQSYVEKIHRSALEFNPGALGLREFLDSDQQIWHLQMIDGDAWTGVTKVYRVLQNTSCALNNYSEGHYTILELERLLIVNRTINLNTLLTSMETPHLLMIVCETSQTINDELRDMFKKLFCILKKEMTMKIILTTQSENDIATFIQEIGTETLGEGFITTDEQLTWSDLTASSQRNVLEKTVIFQGISVALNQLTCAKSITDSFPLADLLQEKELTIGEELVPSAFSGYNEKYYIDRTFIHNIVIKPDIAIDKREGKFADLLANTELEFKQLCQQNPKGNVHWLEKDKSGELVWQQSQGNLKALLKYTDSHKCQSYAPKDLEKLLEQARQQRVMLIADKAGMGKSTVLTHLSKQIKQKFPAQWLARIDLNDYTKMLEAQKGKKMDKGWVREFVSKEVLKLESHLEKELFKRSFEGNEISKVVVMVDGFDEISPSYKETVIDMLKILKETSLEQLWVTTRPHLKEELEDNLQQLSYTLQPFSEVKQVEFLKKFWLQNIKLPELTNQHRLQTYAEALIQKLAQSISDKDKELTGIPLQTRMIAEAFEEDFISFYVSNISDPQFQHKLDLLGLYRKFIVSKYNIYYEEKSKVQKSVLGAENIGERDFKSIEMEHQLLALQVLFTQVQVTFVHSYHHSTFSAEELARIGIAQRNNEGKPQFIHRTFAEYFVAEFLINHLTNETTPDKQVRQFLLKEVLIKMDCHVIRAFMDGLLDKSQPSKEALKGYGGNLHEQWDTTEINGMMAVKTTALHEAAKEGNVRITAFLLDSLKSGESLSVVKMALLAKDRERQMAWHKAAERGHVKVLVELWYWARECQLKSEELKNVLLLSKDCKRETAWHKAVERGHVGVLVKLWDCAKELQIKPEEIRNDVLLSENWYKQTAWHKAAERGNAELLVKLWDWAKELHLNREELRNEVLLSKDEDGHTACHKAAEWGHVEVLVKMWDWAKELQLNPEELRNEVLLSENWYKQTAWHKAAKSGHVEVLVKLWDWAKELQLKPEMFWSKDMSMKTAWHEAAERGNVELLMKMWDWAKELQLKPKELRNKMFWSKDMSMVKGWHKAAECGNVELLVKLWDWAKELQLKPRELRNELLLSKDKNKETGWHKAAHRCHVELLVNLWDLAKELQLKPAELRNELLLSKDIYKKTAWHKAAERGNVELLVKLWDWAKEMQLKPRELRNELLLSKDRYKKTAWHKAAERGNFELLVKLWDWAKELQLKPKELRNELLLSKDGYKKTAWHKAADSCHVELLVKLWDWAKEMQLNPKELRNELLLSKDRYKQTAWHNAAKFGNVELLVKLWDWAKELQLKPEELRNDLLLSKDEDKKTAWHNAAKFGNVELLVKLWDWAKELQLKPEELRNEMLLSKDWFKETAWHRAADSCHVELLVNLWDLAKELQLKPSELRNELLLSKDFSKKTAWHKAAERGNVELIVKLWDWAKELQLNPKELRNELLLSKDWFEKMAWHKAAERGNVELLVKLWDWAKELQLKTKELRNELLLSKDIYKKTAWHKAAERGNVELLVKLWDWAKELQLKPKELRNELLLSKDRYKKTAWHKAADSCHVELLVNLWDWAKELQLNPEELTNELLLSKDRYKQSAWHKAAKIGNVELLVKLWDWAKELQLKPKELRNEWLLSKDKYKVTVWHNAAESGHVEVLVKLWDWAKKLQLKPKELRIEFLLSKDKYMEMAWHKAAERGHVELLMILWDWAKELQLKPEELRNELLLSKDKYGNTACHKAAERGHVEVLVKLWDWAKELQLKPEELRNEVLLSKDKYGNTACQKGAERGHVEVTVKLSDWAKELQLKPEESRNEVLSNSGF